MSAVPSDAGGGVAERLRLLGKSRPRAPPLASRRTQANATDASGDGLSTSIRSPRYSPVETQPAAAEGPLHLATRARSPTSSPAATRRSGAPRGGDTGHRAAQSPRASRLRLLGKGSSPRPRALPGLASIGKFPSRASRARPGAAAPPDACAEPEPRPEPGPTPAAEYKSSPNPGTAARFGARIVAPHLRHRVPPPLPRAAAAVVAASGEQTWWESDTLRRFVLAHAYVPPSVRIPPENGVVIVRPLVPQDEAKIHTGMGMLSDRSKLMRFLAPMTTLPPHLAHQLSHVDGWRHVAIGAVLFPTGADAASEEARHAWHTRQRERAAGAAAAAGRRLPAEGPRPRRVSRAAIEAAARTVTWDEGCGLPIAVGRFVRLPQCPDEAEIALTVVDAFQSCGIGRELLLRLAEVAAGYGVRALVCHSHPDNRPVHKALAKVSHSTSRRRVPDELDAVVYRLPTPSAFGGGNSVQHGTAARGDSAVGAPPSAGPAAAPDSATVPSSFDTETNAWARRAFCRFVGRPHTAGAE